MEQVGGFLEFSAGSSKKVRCSASSQLAKHYKSNTLHCETLKKYFLETSNILLHNVISEHSATFHF